MGTLLLLIQAIAAAEPIIAEVLPSVVSLVNGETITDAEEAGLQSAITALNDKVANAVRAAEAS